MTRLQTSFTTFIKAYKSSPSFLENVGKSEMWVRSSITPDKAYLFNHVYDFFGYNSARVDVDHNQAIIYELRSEFENDSQKEKLFVYNSLFSRKHSLIGNDHEISFDLIKGKGILSPTLIYVPLTEIVLVCLSVRLKDNDQTLENLIEINYKLRVSFAGEVSTITTERRTHPNAKESEDKVALRLNELKDGQADESNFHWTINTLCSYLTADFGTHLEDLSPARLQAFVYSNLDEDLKETEFDDAFFRLRRIYSKNYRPAQRIIDDQKDISQTFDKIYYGASVEGAVVLVKKGDGEFLKNYENIAVNRTLWTFLLAFHQRNALISAAAETNHIFRDNREPLVIELSQLIDRLSKIQLKCLFEEISHYSQQNDFYYLIFSAFRIEGLFREVKEEVVEVEQLLAEKLRRNESKRLIAEEKRNRKNQRMIEVLLALLIIPQIWFAILSTNVDVWQEFVNNNTTLVNILNGAIWLIIVGGVIRLFMLNKH